MLNKSAPMLALLTLRSWLSVAASKPTVKLSLTNGCILEGQHVTLTCQVTYNGTKLMPLVMGWIEYYWYYTAYKYHYIRSNNTVNASSVHQATWTFTAIRRTTETYKCKVNFSSPTGLVLPGVQKQSKYTTGTFYSSRFAPRTVASKTLVYIQIVL